MIEPLEHLRANDDGVRNQRRVTDRTAVDGFPAALYADTARTFVPANTESLLTVQFVVPSAIAGLVHAVLYPPGPSTGQKLAAVESRCYVAFMRLSPPAAPAGPSWPRR